MKNVKFNNTRYWDKPGAKELAGHVSKMNTGLKVINKLLWASVAVGFYVAWQGIQADRTVKKYNLKIKD